MTEINLPNRHLQSTSGASWLLHGAGRIQSRYESPVGFEVDGRLVSRNVDVGAVVTKGQKLAELDAVDYRNRVAAAERRGTTSSQRLASAEPSSVDSPTLRMNCSAATRGGALGPYQAGVYEALAEADLHPKREARGGTHPGF